MATPDELLNDVYEQAMHNETLFYGGTQAVLAALQAKLGVGDGAVFKAGSALSGGVVGRGETCGALTGAIMAIGCLVGRERLEDRAQALKAKAPATEMYLRFRAEVGHS